MGKNITCTKINNDCVRLHFFKLKNSDDKIVKYEFVDYYDKFPKPLKYSPDYYHKGR